MQLKKLLLLFTAAFLFISAQAQEKKMAVISGSVKDARTKKPLNEAVITLSSDVYQGQKFAITDSTGMYRINNLPPGNYTISFEMEGYEKFVHESIALKEGSSIGVSFQMIRERKGRANEAKFKDENSTATEKVTTQKQST